MPKLNKNSYKAGFTIVELLIVVVVIAVLAAIIIVSFNGVQAKARQAKVDSDISTLNKAILAARNTKGEIALRYVTGQTGTSTSCWGMPDGTKLETLALTDTCWTTYTATLNAISTASGVNVRNLVDPWGRPYLIDENEGEGTIPATICRQDQIGVYSRPFVRWQEPTSSKLIPLILSGC